MYRVSNVKLNMDSIKSLAKCNSLARFFVVSVFAHMVDMGLVSSDILWTFTNTTPYKPI